MLGSGTVLSYARQACLGGKHKLGSLRWAGLAEQEASRNTFSKVEGPTMAGSVQLKIVSRAAQQAVTTSGDVLLSMSKSTRIVLLADTEYRGPSPLENARTHNAASATYSESLLPFMFFLRAWVGSQ